MRKRDSEAMRSPEILSIPKKTKSLAMKQIAEQSSPIVSRILVMWLPFCILPVTTYLLLQSWPRWILMWTLSFSIYISLKWLSLADFALSSKANGSKFSLPLATGYLFFWPGMDAHAFFHSKGLAASPTSQEAAWAVGKTIFGTVLFTFGPPLGSSQPLIAGWIAMVGIVFMLHFGLFHILSICWRSVGIDAKPIMQAPLRSSSLSDFWGHRWNLAFRDLSHTFLFLPLVRRWGVAATSMVVFLVSGIVHDISISLPAGDGYGMPTLYFVIQGCGLLLERSAIAKQIGLRTGWPSHCYGMFFAVAPVGLLFHSHFIHRVILPMLIAFGIR